ncbi:unnamed protein product [Heligmosomoides polygyrus]|uniref:Reverse transcriptase domain-containing protein n=1 Tax=Heligmosomoides polygyrus TaxID=6339 RepID=A0A183FUX3_HELPZ|nr:unnamed protein product [Heligmosomoides polygyrus]
MYGAECWPTTKEVETRLSVKEMKMLRWTAGVTRMDCIRNDAIRQKFGVAPIADKMREARLRWATLGSVMCELEWEDMGVKVDGRQLHHLCFADDIVLIKPSISHAADYVGTLDCS